MAVTGLVLLSSQMALQRSVDIIANNIANSSTTGFKREGIAFDTALKHAGGGGAMGSTSYVYDKATYRDSSPGTISTTGNPLDFAIQGPGYFQIQTPQGVQYTRDGAFRTNAQGQLVTSTGMPVLDTAQQPIAFPDDAKNITISGDGFVTAQSGTGATRAQLGKISVVTFADDQQVVPAGGDLLTTTQAPIPVTTNPLVQGAIEESNVKPISEITDLIAVQRAYEQSTNIVGNDNTRLTNAINVLSQVS
ncbi:MAG: flagellar basal-body rod protein FlgF [Alphaproteobacteria bacterium]